jgi:hypothetical protein
MGNEINEWSAHKLKNFLLAKSDTDIDFIGFCEKFIKKKTKQSTRGCYSAMLNHLREFKSEISATDINHKFVAGFLEHIGCVGQRGRRLYLTLFKAVYEAMKDEYNDEDAGVILIQGSPFKRVEIPKNPIPKKRNISAEKIHKLYKLESLDKKYEFARDVFMISFLLCGTNTIDLFNLEKPANGRLSYNRSKTADRRDDNAFISYKIEPELLKYLEKYTGKEKAFDFSERYINPAGFNAKVNDWLKFFVKELDLQPDFSTYYARHSWATIARNKCGISKDDISLCLNHTTGRMVADEYIETDYSLIDEANRKVIDFVFNSKTALI